MESLHLYTTSGNRCPRSKLALQLSPCGDPVNTQSNQECMLPLSTWASIVVFGWVCWGMGYATARILATLPSGGSGPSPSPPCRSETTVRVQAHWPDVERGCIPTATSGPAPGSEPTVSRYCQSVTGPVDKPPHLAGPEPTTGHRISMQACMAQRMRAHVDYSRVSTGAVNPVLTAYAYRSTH